MTALKSYIAGLDFENISPNEMNQLAQKLYDSGELSPEQVDAFKGIEGDTIVPMDKDKKMNVIDHFNWMYDMVVQDARSDSTFNFGVSWRKASIETLNAVRAFAVSDKAHIL